MQDRNLVLLYYPNTTRMMTICEELVGVIEGVIEELKDVPKEFEVDRKQLKGMAEEIIGVHLAERIGDHFMAVVPPRSLTPLLA